MSLLRWLVRLFAGSPSRGAGGSSSVVSPPAQSAVSGKRESRTLDNLDLGKLAPLSHEQVRRRARFTGPLFGNPWFGRRDLIPPLRDSRTQLIDRGMVGQGLISQEELAEIHRVGEEMDKIRPDLALAREMAGEEVARSEEERQQRKQQKKQEAAERKKRRADEIQRRRQTDIVFLGRGVSRDLADRRARVERLEQQGIPVLSTPAELAEAMGVTISKLRWLAFHNEAATRVHYVSFFVPKRSGGQRRLSAPHRQLRHCQEWILRQILVQIPIHEAAHGFVAGRSTVTGAALHTGSDVVLNVDLEDFFPSVTFSRVKGAFRSLGYSPAVATILSLLCTESPRRTMQYNGQSYHVATGPRCLPQGACTSPALSNLVTNRLDRRLAGMAKKLSWNYSRYADDLTFSASAEPSNKLAYLLARIRHIVQDEGFAINQKKSRVQRQNVRQTVTGIVVNQQTAIPRHVVRRIRAILHRAQYEGLGKQNRDGIPHFESWLAGMIAYISMVSPQQGQTLRDAFEALRASE